MTRIILASQSATRRRMLEDAGITCEAVASDVDETPIKTRLRENGAEPQQMAAYLAEQKALAVGRNMPDSLVIGADQVLEFGRSMLDKPASRAEALEQLKLLRGHDHALTTAVCVVEHTMVTWRHFEHAKLRMRAASDEFLESYLARLGDRALAGPGAYQIEGLGAQLIERVDGDFYSVLGLPLLPLLAFLRERGILPT